MITRYIASTALALAVTFGLFFVMQYLISMGSGKADLSKGGGVIQFVRLKHESELELRKRKLPEKHKQEEEPPPPELQLAKPEGPQAGEMAIAAPSTNTNVRMAGGFNLGAAPSDTDIVPLVRVPPIYPVRAQERGIEGYVILRFTISPTGTVKSPIVLDSKPSHIFDRAAIRALKKWKYRPKIEDGKAVERPGVEVKLTFDLDDA